MASAEEIRLGATRQSEETLATMHARARDAETALEEKVAWRKEQLEREIAALESRRATALAQLSNLRALAEESARFEDDLTAVISKDDTPQ